MKLIAEMCQNHLGDVSLLKRMVYAAKGAGATHAKIQNLYSHELVKREEFENKTPSKFQTYRPFDSEQSRLMKLDLSLEDEKEFVRTCIDQDIVPMTTVFTHFGALRASEAGFVNIKIASYSSTEIGLIHEVCNFARSVVISTGATTMTELEHIAQELRHLAKTVTISLLHCKTEYPNRLEAVHLARMQWLSDYFGFETGFSDHSLMRNSDGTTTKNALLPSKVAIYLGAKIVEKHFTVLSHDATKDGPISADATEVRELVDFWSLPRAEQKNFLDGFSKEVSQIIGSEVNDFDPSVEEWANRRYYKGRVKTIAR